MKVITLPLETRAATGFTHKVVITYADLTDTADVTKSIAILPASGTWRAGTVIKDCAIRLKTAFDGGATSAMTLQVGETDTDRYLPATQVHVDSTEILYFQTANVTDTLPYATLAADTIDALFTATGANLTALTTGEVHIYLAVYNLQDLDNS